MALTTSPARPRASLCLSGSGCVSPTPPPPVPSRRAILFLAVVARTRGRLWRGPKLGGSCQRVLLPTGSPSSFFNTTHAAPTVIVAHHGSLRSHRN